MQSGRRKQGKSGNPKPQDLAARQPGAAAPTAVAPGGNLRPPPICPPDNVAGFLGGGGGEADDPRSNPITYGNYGTKGSGAGGGGANSLDSTASIKLPPKRDSVAARHKSSNVVTVGSSKQTVRLTSEEHQHHSRWRKSPEYSPERFYSEDSGGQNKKQIARIINEKSFRSRPPGDEHSPAPMSAAVSSGSSSGGGSEKEGKCPKCCTS